MTLQQLRYLCEVVRCKLNISTAARALGASQPAVSQQIRLLEEDLGVPVFIRSRTRLIGLTPKGEEIVAASQNVLADVANVQTVAEAPLRVSTPEIRLVSTHAQARYVLPAVIRQFKEKCPRAEVHIAPKNDEKLWQLVLHGQADLAITTDAYGMPKALLELPCLPMQRSLIAPRRHPLLRARTISLKAIAEHPLVTTDLRSAGPRRLMRAFTALGLMPKIAVTATNEDVIKACVEEGLGVAILASIVFDPDRDRKLGTRDVTPLLEPSVTSVVVRRNTLKLEHVASFIECFAPRWSREALSPMAHDRSMPRPGP